MQFAHGGESRRCLLVGWINAVNGLKRSNHSRVIGTRAYVFGSRLQRFSQADSPVVSGLGTWAAGSRGKREGCDAE